MLGLGLIIRPLLILLGGFIAFASYKSWAWWFYMPGIGWIKDKTNKETARWVGIGIGIFLVLLAIGLVF